MSVFYCNGIMKVNYLITLIFLISLSAVTLCADKDSKIFVIHILLLLLGIRHIVVWNLEVIKSRLTILLQLHIPIYLSRVGFECAVMAIF